MKRRGTWNVVHVVLAKAQWILGFLVIALGAALKADPAKWRLRWEFAGKALSAANDYSWLILPGVVLLIGIAELIQRRIGAPWMRDMVHHALDSIQRDAFTGYPDPREDHHRVTLFRHVRWRWTMEHLPWSGWLVPAERSGHMTRNTKVAFWAPDAPDWAEGIAGKAWATSESISVSTLPDLGTSPSDAAYSAYAATKPPLARSFYGLRIQVKGKPWGVIVLDSRDPRPIQGDRSFRLVAGILGKLLERA